MIFLIFSHKIFCFAAGKGADDSRGSGRTEDLHQKSEPPEFLCSFNKGKKTAAETRRLFTIAMQSYHMGREGRSLMRR